MSVFSRCVPHGTVWVGAPACFSSPLSVPRETNQNSRDDGLKVDRAQAMIGVRLVSAVVVVARAETLETDFCVASRGATNESNPI